MRFPGTTAVALCALALTLGAGAPAQAKSAADTRVEKLVAEAQKQYEAGEYEKSADTLQRAYEVKALPKLLFNIARTYDKANNEDQAIRFYTRYVDTGDDAELMRKATAAIDRLKAAKEARETAERKKQEEERANTEKARRDAEEAQARSKKEAEEARLAKEKAEKDAENARLAAKLQAENSGPNVPAIVAAGVGVAGISTGVVFGILASDSKKSFDASTVLDDKKTLMSQAKTRALIADVGYGVGGVAAAAAVYLFMRDRGPQTPVPGASVSGGSAHLSLTWSFE